jgi:hypothetical protein
MEIKENWSFDQFMPTFWYNEIFTLSGNAPPYFNGYLFWRQGTILGLGIFAYFGYHYHCRGRVSW